jgi:hypothetical protein
MRSLIAGLVLAIIFLALIFAAPRFLPNGIEGVTRSEVAQIGPGFSGTKYIGSWALVCSPRGQASTDETGSNATAGRCRMARYYRDKFGQLILTIAFRYAGPSQLTMIVRYPPVGGKGQYLTLVLASKLRLRLPVFGCNKTACIAVGALIPAAESMLVATPQAQVVLPQGVDGKQYSIRVRLDDLAPALAGIKRAEL